MSWVVESSGLVAGEKEQIGDDILGSLGKRAAASFRVHEWILDSGDECQWSINP